MSLDGGVLRVACVAAGPDNEQRQSSTLLIPGDQAGKIAQSLRLALDQLSGRLRAK